MNGEERTRRQRGNKLLGTSSGCRRTLPPASKQPRRGAGAGGRAPTCFVILSAHSRAQLFCGDVRAWLGEGDAVRHKPDGCVQAGVACRSFALGECRAARGSIGTSGLPSASATWGGRLRGSWGAADFGRAERAVPRLEHRRRLSSRVWDPKGARPLWQCLHCGTNGSYHRQRCGGGRLRRWAGVGDQASGAAVEQGRQPSGIRRR